MANIKALSEELELYEKKIFEFDHENNDFKPYKLGRSFPDDGFYLTIRCGLSGIYTMVNEFKNGKWQIGVLDNSDTIAYSRNKITIKNM